MLTACMFLKCAKSLKSTHNLQLKSSDALATFHKNSTYICLKWHFYLKFGAVPSSSDDSCLSPCMIMRRDLVVPLSLNLQGYRSYRNVMITSTSTAICSQRH